MYISELKQAKKDPNRVHLYVDEKYFGTIHIDMMLSHKIVSRMEIPEEIVREAIAESNQKKTF